MENRKLGRETMVSAIGIGAMSFSDFYGPTDTDKSHAILSEALDLGIDHIDVAEPKTLQQKAGLELFDGFLDKRTPTFCSCIVQVNQEFPAYIN